MDKDTINFADVDDIFSQTTVQAPRPEDIDLIPRYAAPHRQLFSFVIPSRPLPPIQDYGSLIHGTVAGEGQPVAAGVQKTYPDNITFMIMLRLFFFVFHGHFLLCLVCLLLNVDVSFSAALWILSATEVMMMLLKAATTALLLELNYPRPPLLDLLELVLCLAFGVAMLVDLFTHEASDFWERIDSLFGHDGLNVVFLLVLVIIGAIREGVRLVWKHREGYWDQVNPLPFVRATSICRLRQYQVEQGPTEPHAGHSTFLLSSGGAGGRYY